MSANRIRGELPEPVARYLALAWPDDFAKQTPASVTFEQQGELRTRTSGKRWFSFRATHTVRPRETGFSWNARVRIAPLVELHVADSLEAGRGCGEVRWAGLRVSRISGAPELDSGELHRFLAEAPFYPWALFPRPGLAWTAVDERRAVATLQVFEREVALEFRFDSSGLVKSVFTPARWGRFDGHFAQQPWEGNFSDYRQIAGVLLPTAAEVGWYAQGKLETVWSGRILRAQVKQD